jgi:uncharacterized protein YodC (DUF2158 family)
MREVYDIGTKVSIKGIDKSKATIRAICVEGLDKSVSYKCTWWEKGNKKAEWLEPDEFKIESDDTKLTKIGFK